MLDTPQERLRESIDHLKAMFRRPWVRVIKPAPLDRAISTCSRVCVFAHFNKQGRIEPWTQHYLRTLHRSRFATILVSTSPHLEPGDVAAISPFCDAILHRKNSGYDFGSWRAGLEYIEYRMWPSATVLICNDSVLGPLVDLEPILRRFEASGDAVWGLTENREVRPHLQSYFLLFRGDCFAIREFRRFWGAIRMKADKEGIVLRYEIGLTDLLRRLKLSWRAAFPSAAVERHPGWYPHPPGTTNQTLFLWDTLLREYSFPFVKRILLNGYVEQIPSVTGWPAVVLGMPDLLPDARALVIEVAQGAKAH